MELKLHNKFKCSICLEFIVSPVQKCIQGHKVCGACFDTFKKCGVCGNQLFASEFLEEIIQRSEIYIQCRNAEKGCDRIIKVTDMKDHVTNVCEYRKIACPCHGYNNCDVERIALKDLYEHLKEIHEVHEISIENGGYFQYQHSFNIDHEITSKITCAVKFEDNVFLVNTVYLEDALCFWVAVIGDDTDANKYRFQIPFKVIYTGTEEPFTAEYAVSLPVIPVHNSNFERVKQKGDFIAIPREKLCDFFKEIEDPGMTKSKNEYAWKVVNKIVKV